MCNSGRAGMFRPMTDRYDVIIVGSGAGGGTLAHTLAPSGKKILLLERGDFLPRELENWDAKAVFVDGRYISPDTWYDEKGKPFQPQVHYFVGGATKMYGAALYRLRPADFGEIKYSDGVSPAWPLDYRRARAVLHQGRVALPGARQPRRGPDRGSGLEAVPVAAGVARATDAADLPTTWPRPGTTRSTRRAGSCSNEDHRAASACIRCAWVRRLSLPGARQVRRRGDRGPAAAWPAERHAADRRRGDRRCGPTRRAAA